MDDVSILTLSVAKGYTDESIAGGGAIKGKNCIIDSIADITGGHRVTFKWTLDNGTVKTEIMDVMDGSKGETGLGIKAVSVNASNHLIVTYDDDTTEDAGEIKDVTTSFNKITDVDLSNLVDGQILKYNVTTGKWENANAGSVDTNLVDLNDVDVENLADGQIIVWDAVKGRWVNAAIRTGDMLKSIYDTDNDGKVDSADNADTVDGHTVAKDVPADAKFTDTVYDDTALAARVTAVESGKSDKAINPTSGDIAILNSDGSFRDSGTKLKKQSVITLAKNNVEIPLAIISDISIEPMVSVSATFVCDVTTSISITSTDTSVATVTHEAQQEAGSDMLTITINITPVGVGCCSIKIQQNDTSTYHGTTDFISVRVNEAYGDKTVTLSTSAETTVTFSDSCITTSSLIDLAISEWGLIPSDVTVASGVCTVTLPKVDTAHSVTVRIYVR